MARKYTDGRAVNAVSNATLPKGSPVYLGGFHGFTMDSSVNGDDVAIDVAEQTWEVTIPAGLAAARGAVLNILTTGAHTIVASGTASSVPFLKVEVAKDANNVVIAKQLPQATA